MQFAALLPGFFSLCCDLAFVAGLCVSVAVVSVLLLCCVAVAGVNGSQFCGREVEKRGREREREIDEHEYVLHIASDKIYVSSRN